MCNENKNTDSNKTKFVDKVKDGCKKYGKTILKWTVGIVVTGLAVGYAYQQYHKDDSDASNGNSGNTDNSQNIVDAISDAASKLTH